MSEWISVEDQMPEFGIKVMAIWRPIDWEERPFHREIIVGTFHIEEYSEISDKPFFWSNQEYDMETHITHRQPLPELPRGKDDE